MPRWISENSSTDLDRSYKIMDVLKNIYKIDMYESGGYSRDGEWEANGSYSRGYERGSSYRNRDSMGRYASRGYSHGNYARDDGTYYSGGTIEEHLDAMLREARTDEERRMIEDMRRKMM